MQLNVEALELYIMAIYSSSKLTSNMQLIIVTSFLRIGKEYVVSLHFHESCKTEYADQVITLENLTSCGRRFNMVQD